MHYKEIRQQKLEKWSEIQLNYPDSFKKTNKTTDSFNDGDQIALAGRIMLHRTIGKIAFLKLQDFYGALQISFKFETLGQDLFDFYEKNLDLGDYIGVKGSIFTTNKGEKTLNVESLILLSKCLHPLPEKWHGLEDEEQKLRQRYLDLLVNQETKEKFKKRSKIISSVKRFLEDNEFIEVETPILQKQASGALATPFQTHHKALDMPLFLRIAPETYLKRLMTGGYEKIFELGKSFRNEGIDTSHLQEFTMLEFYAAYWNYKDAINFVKQIFANIFKFAEIDPSNVKYLNHTIDFQSEWQIISYNDLVFKYTKLNLNELLQDENKFYEAAAEFIDIKEYKSLASCIDGLYKKHCRPNLINPCIITNQPSVLGPLARVNEENEIWSDRFQVVVAGLEIVNSYSELVNPVEQRKALENQALLAKSGDEEAMVMEDDFLLAMEYGMPPMAGVGIGIDRVVALLTNSESLRDVVFFPNLR